MNFIVYNTEGAILRTGSCPEEMIELQTGDGELVMEGTVNDVTQMVIDGQVVDKPVQSV